MKGKLKCNCCLEERDISKYHKIELKIKDSIKKFALITEICEDCLSIDDVDALIKDSKMVYSLKNLKKYNEILQKNYVKTVFGDQLEDYYSISECLALMNLKVNKRLVKRYKVLFAADKYAMFFKMIKIRTSVINKTNTKTFILKKDFNNFLNFKKCAKYQKSNIFKIPKEKLEPLLSTKWVKFYNNNYYFLVEGNGASKLCRWCGEVKPSKKFEREGQVEGRRHSYQCKKCASIARRENWKKLNDEKKSEIIEQIKKQNQDPKKKIFQNLRKRAGEFKDGNGKNKYSLDIGCSKEEFIKYIESKFQNGMTWENYGNPNMNHSDGWHLDHVIPLSKFEGTHPNHYTNVRPMWGLDNLSKHAKIINNDENK